MKRLNKIAKRILAFDETIENFINEYEYNNFTGKDAVSKKIIDSLEII